MASHYATVDVWIGSVGPDEDDAIREHIAEALADYQATVDVTIYDYSEEG